MKKYLVSGVPISDSGVGRLMKKMVPEAISRNYIIITPPLKRSIKEMLQNRSYYYAAWEILNRLLKNLLFNLKLFLIRNSEILFIHPQTFGFSRFFRLAKTNKLYLYVMDNSFFCIRSYNVHPDDHLECLRCLQNPQKALNECQPYPIPYSRKQNLSDLKTFMKISHEIIFLAQNNSQKSLLEKHFGKNIECIIVGLDTGEFSEKSESRTSKFLSPKLRNEYVHEENIYDIVYHGSTQLAKGISYVVSLAMDLKEFSFFIPESRGDCELSIGQSIECENIVFHPCRWESGLKNAVANARLVINPSLWSASIEGALLKSVFYADKVATVQTEYGFEKELAEYTDLIRLPREVSDAARVLREILQNHNLEVSYKFYTHDLSRFLGSQSIFDVIESHN